MESRSLRDVSLWGIIPNVALLLASLYLIVAGRPLYGADMASLLLTCAGVATMLCAGLAYAVNRDGLRVAAITFLAGIVISSLGALVEIWWA